MISIGAVLTVLGMLLAPKILVLMGTPADVLPESIVYFRTYFAGSMGADPTPMPRPAIKKISRTTLTQEEIIRYISGWRPSPTDCRTPTKILYMTAPVLITAFNRDPDVVHYGVMQSRTIALFYCLLAFSHCIAAVLRGSGNASVPMIVMLCDWCLFRVSYITVAVRILPDIRVIFWAYPLTWGISSAIFLYLFLRGKWVYGFEKS